MSLRATARSGSSSGRARIGILGGTFDPVHAGHAALARSAVRELGLRRLFVVPARVSPFKSGVSSAPVRHRLNMLRLAFKGAGNIPLSLLEVRRKGLSYTVDTVRAFRKRFPDAELFLVMGSDSFSSFKRWREWRSILTLCRPVVGLRPGAPLKRNVLPAPWNKNLVTLRSRHPDVSATALRGGRLPGRCLAPAVRDYIQEHGLYEAR